MFPGYLFAEFIYRDKHRQVRHTTGVRQILQFGERVAVLEANAIVALRQRAGNEEVVTINPEFEVGQAVRITEGPFQGLEAIVTRLLPARDRVRVLFDWLNRPLELEAPLPQILPVAPPRI